MANIVEDFEDSTFNVTFTEAPGSDLPWFRSQLSVRSGGGSWAYKSGNITNDQVSEMRLAVPVGATHIQFWYLVSSEQDFDFFSVYLNNGSSDSEVFSLSGNGSWSQTNLVSLSGIQFIRFRYVKDGLVGENLDAGFIDDVTFFMPSDPVGIPSFTSRPNRVWRLR